MIKPQYPIYVISKGRFENCLTAKLFIKDEVDFKLVIEPQEEEEYTKRFTKERILVLPFSNLGLGSIPARNWVWEHAKKAGFKRHWIVDDNIRQMRRNGVKNQRIPINSNMALKVIEDFTDRYENIGISGPNYNFFAIDTIPPFFLNVHVYSCLLIDNALTVRWRGRYNEDTDLCLQVLSKGLCTVLINVFLIEKARTMTMKGGNSDQLYQGDGRLIMARSLERMWPGVVRTVRKFKRPQHHILGNWRKFDTPLIRRTDIDWDKLKGNNEYGMTLTKMKEIKSPKIEAIYKEYNK